MKLKYAEKQQYVGRLLLPFRSIKLKWWQPRSNTNILAECGNMGEVTSWFSGNRKITWNFCIRSVVNSHLHRLFDWARVGTFNSWCSFSLASTAQLFSLLRLIRAVFSRVRVRFWGSWGTVSMTRIAIHKAFCVIFARQRFVLFCLPEFMW